MNCFASLSRNVRLCSLACIALLLSTGCSDSKVLTLFQPYRIDIQQGNVVTPEMVARLKPGMTRSQVRFALGTPLLVDTFRTDRWDYVYYFEKPNEPRVYHHVAVYFKGDKFDRLEGDILPPRDEKKEKAPAGPESKPVATDSKPVAPEAGATPTSAAESAGQKPDASGAGQTTAKESKPAAKRPAQDGGGYSEPIKDSLGF